jgi:dTDP-4-amino-4,6-dideoxygalactose transaminase
MSPSTDFVPFSRPTLGTEEEQAAVDVIRSGWLTTGPQAAAFEVEFARSVGARHAMAVCSATAGLHLALEALGVGPGDLVATTPYTFTATAEVIRYLGADPLFVDVDARTFNLDPAKLDQALSGPMGAQRRGRLKAVLPVHIGGYPCDLSAIGAAAAVPVVEDAAHAFPSVLDGRQLGTIGAAGVYSFYANKTMTTGEGGMVVTDRDDLATRVRIMRNHGIDREAWTRYTSQSAGWRYAVVEAGYKYNLTDIAAAIGRVQLRRAAGFLEARRQVAAAYLQRLAGLQFVELPPDSPAHAWHLFLLRLRPERLSITRDAFIEQLRARGIGTSVHYIPLHIMPYYSGRYRLAPADFPVALDCFERVISLPIYPGLTDGQVGRVVEAVRQIGYSAAR